jgi:disulfide bond formation protein DsbB
MDEQTVSPLLALAAFGAVFASLLVAMGVDVPSASGFRRLVANRAQAGALAVAGAAMLGSLYYSEIADFVPCEFCWFQRIAMYPLAVLLLVATVSRQQIPVRYPVALAVIGLALSIYHYQLQLFPEQATACSGAGGPPCSGRYVWEFEMVSIPFMAGCAFFSILVLYAARWRARRLLGR